MADSSNPGPSSQSAPVISGTSTHQTNPPTSASQPKKPEEHDDGPDLPVNQTTLECMSQFLYDPATGQVLYKTPRTWCELLVFYLVFYSILTAFWLVAFKVFSLPIRDDRPIWIGAEGVLRDKPTLSVQPVSFNPAGRTSRLYYVRNEWNPSGNSSSAFNEDSDYGLALRLQRFLQTDLASVQEGTVPCDENELKVPRNGTTGSCRFSVSELGECANFPFGYGPSGATPEANNDNSLDNSSSSNSSSMSDSSSNVAPCIIIRMNRIFGFTPKPFDAFDFDEIDGLPQSVKARVENQDEPPRVYFSCEGENGVDKEALEGNLRYFPEHQGVPIGFFPANNRTSLSSPLVAVQFLNVPRGQVIEVICKAWYKGVVHDLFDRSGIATFSILID